MLWRVCLVEIWSYLFWHRVLLKHVSGISRCYLHGAIEWCVLWSLYVGTLIASETHAIYRPWRWRLYIPPKCWCPSAVLQGVTVYVTSFLTTCVNEISRNVLSTRWAKGRYTVYSILYTYFWTTLYFKAAP